MEEEKNYEEKVESIETPGFQESIPNAGLTLTLGILSIPFCCCFPISLPLGIIAWVMGNKGLARYKEDPKAFTAASYSNVSTGRITAIVGVVLTILFLVYLIVSTMIGIEQFGGWDAYMEKVREM